MTHEGRGLVNLLVTALVVGVSAPRSGAPCSTRRRGGVMAQVARRAEVVVLGGGLVGVEACRALRRRLRRPLARGEVRVTLVSDVPVARGDGLGWSAGPPSTAARVVRGTATAVDLARRVLTVLGDDGVVEHR